MVSDDRRDPEIPTRRTIMEVDWSMVSALFNSLADAKQQLGKIDGKLLSYSHDVNVTAKSIDEVMGLVRGERGDNGLTSRIAAVERTQKAVLWLLGVVVASIVAMLVRSWFSS